MNKNYKDSYRVLGFEKITAPKKLDKKEQPRVTKNVSKGDLRCGGKK